jgi:hypothetical protein
MKTLKPMVQFVKDEYDYLTCKDASPFFVEKVIDHALLLCQQPNIGMFVPAVCENGVWRVLEEPTVDSYMQPKEMDKQYASYQQAKSKVIFKGFYLVGNGFEWDKTVFEIENELYFIEFIGNEITLNMNALDKDIQIYTLEDLVKFNLEMV